MIGHGMLNMFDHLKYHQYQKKSTSDRKHEKTSNSSIHRSISPALDE